MSKTTAELKTELEAIEAHERSVAAGEVAAYRKLIAAEDAEQQARLALERAEAELERARAAQDAARNAASCAAIQRARAYRVWSNSFHGFHRPAA
jgi:hypothetical protein